MNQFRQPVTGSVVVSQTDLHGLSTKLTSKLVNGQTVDLSAKGLVYMQVPDVPYPITTSGKTWESNGNAVKNYLLSTATTGSYAGKPKFEAILRTAFSSQSDLWNDIHANPSDYTIVVYTVCKLQLGHYSSIADF